MTTSMTRDVGIRIILRGLTKWERRIRDGTLFLFLPPEADLNGRKILIDVNKSLFCLNYYLSL